MSVAESWNVQMGLVIRAAGGNPTVSAILTMVQEVVILMRPAS